MTIDEFMKVIGFKITEEGVATCEGALCCCGEMIATCGGQPDIVAIHLEQLYKEHKPHLLQAKMLIGKVLN